MICVECGQPVNDLHHQFRGAGIRLTRCEYCKCVADKYVEHEAVIIFLDLVVSPLPKRAGILGLLQTTSDTIEPVAFCSMCRTCVYV